MSADDFDFDDELTDDLGESIGYRHDYDWTELSEEEGDFHDRIMDMSLEEAQKLKLGTLTDLQRWALAQLYAEFEEDDGFERVCREIVTGPADHPALDYGEIAIELITDLLLSRRLEEARAILPRVSDLCDDEGHVRARFEAMLLILDGEREAGLERFQALIDEAGTDPIILLELGEDLLGCSCFDEALAVFSEVEELGRHDNDQELVEAAAEMRAFSEELRNAHAEESATH